MENLDEEMCIIFTVIFISIILHIHSIKLFLMSHFCVAGELVEDAHAQAL